MAWEELKDWIKGRSELLIQVLRGDSGVRVPVQFRLISYLDYGTTWAFIQFILPRSVMPK